MTSPAWWSSHVVSAAAGVEIVSSGGTATSLSEAGLSVTLVSDVTGAAEILGGRVKTLHPRIHGGILARRGDPDHQRQLEEQGIKPFELVVVNLYPFRRLWLRAMSRDEAIEQIDIGGPAMIRAAAKNQEFGGGSHESRPGTRRSPNRSRPVESNTKLGSLARSLFPYRRL